jgi:hypothetical protein
MVRAPDAVLTDGSRTKSKRKEQEKQSRCLEPKQAQNSGQRAERRLCASSNGIANATRLRVAGPRQRLVGRRQECAEFLCSANLAHSRILAAGWLAFFIAQLAFMRHIFFGLHPMKLRQAIGPARSPGLKGQRSTVLNPRLKQLMKELGDAINESLSESEQISDVISKIKQGGYDVFLVLEATIGFNRRDEEPVGKPTLVKDKKGDPEFRLNAQDLKFLKSLRISSEDAA